MAVHKQKPNMDLQYGRLCDHLRKPTVDKWGKGAKHYYCRRDKHLVGDPASACRGCRWFE